MGGTGSEFSVGPEGIVAEEVGQALRSPFSLGDTDVLASCFADAGIGDVMIESLEGEARFPDVGTMVASDVRGWFPFAQIRPDQQAVDVVTREAEEALAPFTGPDGTVEFPLPVHIASAVRA